MSRLRYFAMPVLLLLGIVPLRAAEEEADRERPRHHVLVELFTSQG